MSNNVAREELRPYLRAEPSPPPATLLLRGGRDDVALIAAHARRTHRLYCLDGSPLWGISLFAALDSSGPASRDGLLAGRLASYEQVHVASAAALLTAGFDLLPSFRRPHFTVRLAGGSRAEAERLLAALGPSEENPYNRGVRLRRTERS